MQIARVSRRLINEGGEYIASRLLRLAEGDIDEPSTWHSVALAMGVRVYLYDSHRARAGERLQTTETWWAGTQPRGKPEGERR